MAWRFHRLYQAFIGLCIFGVAWSLWGAVQGEPAVSGAATNAAPAGIVQRVIADRTALSFGLDRFDYLRNNQIVGLPLWQYAASAVYILLAFLVARLLDAVTQVWLKKWAKGTETELDDLLIEVLHGPIKVVAFVIFLNVGLSMFDWPKRVEVLLAKGLLIVVAFSLTYMVVKVVDLLMAHIAKKAAKDDEKAFDQLLFPVIRKSLKVFVIIVATLLTSSNLGVDITGVIASLSIGGLAIGLAAQDTLANLFGAVAIFMDKPFRLGDRIKLDSVDGNVESIGLRSTRVRNLEGHLITIPNKTMGNGIITNISRRPNIKTVMNFGLTYNTSVAQIRRAVEILTEIFKGHPKTFDVLITFNTFADSSLNVEVVHWWNDTDHKAYLVGLQQMNLSIKERFDKEGIDLAFPTRTVYLKQDRALT